MVRGISGETAGNVFRAVAVKDESEKPKTSPSPENERPKLSEQEKADRLTILASLARTVGKDSAMRVRIGTKEGWRYKFKPVNAIEIDPKDITERSLDYCRGIICHEGAHRRVSRVDFVEKKLWQTTGFSFLLNAVEDPRVNNWVSAEYAGAHEWLDEAYKEDLSEERRLETAAREKMGYIPRHIRAGLEIIRQWHTGKVAPETPEEVRDVLDKILPDARAAYELYPGQEPKEEEIERTAEDSYIIVRDKIWPEYKKLVDEAHDEEALRQLIKQLMEDAGLELPPEAMSGGDDGEEGKEQKEPKGEPEDKEDTPSETSSGAQEKQEPKPLSDLPEEVRKEIEEKIKELLEGMSEEEREKLFDEAEKKAKEILDELDDELDKELGGKMSEHPETAAEAKTRQEAKEKEKEEEVKARAKARADDLARKEREQKEWAQKTAYEKAMAEVAPYVEQVAEDIISAFAQKRHPAFRKGFPGQKLRLKGAMRYESSDEYTELFERRLSIERPEYDIALLVDLSGSMSGQKIIETFRGAVLCAEVLARVADVLGGAIKFSISGFQDVLIDYKTDEEEFGEKIRQKMNSMPCEVENKGVHNNSNYNCDGYCVDGAHQRLQKMGARKKIMIVLSDGQPASDGVHRVSRYSELSDDEELKKVVADISTAGDTALLGIGLGPGTDHVADYYNRELPNVDNIPNVDLRRLSETIGEVLKNLLIQ